MPGRPKRLTDKLESSQRNKLYPERQKGETGVGYGPESEGAVRDVPEVPVDDRPGAQSVQPVEKDSSSGRQKPTYEPMVHGRHLGPHIRAQESAGIRDTKEVPGEVHSEGVSGKAATDGGRYGAGEKKKAPISHRLLGWVTRRITKRVTKGKKGTSTVPEEQNTSPVDSTPTDTAPVKFIVSKQIRSVIIHNIVPLLCVIGFNALRIAKPDLLWSEDQDEVAVQQITNLVNEGLLAFSAVMTVVGSARDLNSFRTAKKNQQDPPK